MMLLNSAIGGQKKICYKVQMKLNMLIEDYAYEIEGFLSQEECRDLIEYSENKKYEQAKIITEQGEIRAEEIRNNDRLIEDNPEKANDLWQKLKTSIPQVFEEKHPIGLNERLRFYRYDEGQKFDWHMDGPYERENGERSYFTFMIYLNDDFKGGGTSFSNFKSPIMFDEFTVSPQTGKALIFFHPIFHRGDSVEEGRKYILRSDIMYSNK